MSYALPEFPPFATALVGGAVRDLILGRQPKDWDFVVVGTTVEEFQRSNPGSQLCGRAFPVFLTESRLEVALARRERKTGPGHTGFTVEFGPEVSLEEDLSRRDLTMNAIAMFPDGSVFDPHNGQKDIRDRILRHVTDAFKDDPLRVFRLARFAAQLDFTVAPETIIVAKSMKDSLKEISAERVCEEFRKAMRSPRPRRFFEVLEECDALSFWFPEVEKLRTVPAGSVVNHPEGDAFIHAMMVLDEAVKLGGREIEVVAACCHDLGKAETDPKLLPHHHGHEERGVELAERLLARLRMPEEFIRAAKTACEQHLRVRLCFEMRSAKIVDTVMLLDRSPLGVKGMILVSESDSRGRSVVVPRIESLRVFEKIAAEVLKIQGRDILSECSEVGPRFGEHLRRKRAAAVRKVLKQYRAELHTTQDM